MHVKASKKAKEEFELLREAGYSDRAITLYKDKVNVGPIENPDIALAYTGPCGDTLELYLKIDNNGIIENAKFQHWGCPGAASSASMMTELIKGKTLDEANKITERDILRELEGLPESKLDCPKLATTTLHKAIAKYIFHYVSRAQ
jgi:NifU-like protein involved in Fe-S cluster formation